MTQGGWTGADWRDDLPSLSVDVVMRRWRYYARRRDAWARMPLDDVDGEVRGIVRELLSIGREVRDVAGQARLRRAAALHGAFRRRQGVSEDSINGDAGMVLRACRSALKDSAVPSENVGELLRILVFQLRTVEWASRDTFREIGRRHL